MGSSHELVDEVTWYLNTILNYNDWTSSGVPFQKLAKAVIETGNAQEFVDKTPEVRSSHSQNSSQVMFSVGVNHTFVSVEMLVADRRRSSG